MSELPTQKEYNNNIYPLADIINPLERDKKDLYDFGLMLIKNNIQPLIVDLITKSPLAKHKWKPLQDRLQSEQEYSHNYLTELIDKKRFDEKYAIAGVGGKVSKGLICLDFDNKDGKADERFNQFMKVPFIAELHNKKPFLMEKTQSKGVHIWIRLNITEELSSDLIKKLLKSNKYAQKPNIDEKTGEIKREGITLIETKAEGGYGIFYLDKNNFFSPPTCEAEEIQEILKIAQSFDEIGNFQKSFSEFKSPIIQNADGSRPGDLFNTLPTTQNEIQDLLTSSGYTYSHSNLKGDFYTRPGKDKGVSCCYNGITLYNYSSNDPYFNSEQAFNNFQIFTFIKHNGDFKAAAKELAERTEINELLPVKSKSKKKNGNADDNKVIQKYFIDIIQTDEGIKYNYSLTRLIDFLQKELNIYRYAINPDEQIKTKVIYDLVQINGKIIKRINLSNIKTDILPKYFEPDELDYIQKNSHKILNEVNTFEYLKVFKGDFNKNTEDKKYLYFKNKFAVVTKNEKNDYLGDSKIPVIKPNYEIKEYSELPSYIWEDSKLDHNILEKTDRKSDFWTFLMKVGGLYVGNEKNEGATVNDLLHYYAIITSFAQYLDDFNSPKNKFVALLDQRQKGDLETDKATGRTGKTVIEQAIKNIIKETVFIDGKKFDPKDNFAWQTIKPTTKVIVLDDLKSNFDLSALYSIYSIGLTVNPKNKPAFKFEPFNNPKIIFSTNYTVKTVNQSDKARIKEVELAPYYSLSFTPIDDFGHYLFNDWNGEQWSEFYFDCLEMLQLYTDYGLIDYELINVTDRKAIQILGVTLYNIVIDYFTKDVSTSDFYDLQEDLNGDIKVYKDNFYKFYEGMAKADGINKPFTKQTMITKINDFLDLKNIEYKQSRSGNRLYWLLNKDNFEDKVKISEQNDQDPADRTASENIPF